MNTWMIWKSASSILINNSKHHIPYSPSYSTRWRMHLLTTSYWHCPTPSNQESGKAKNLPRSLLAHPSTMQRLKQRLKEALARARLLTSAGPTWSPVAVCQSIVVALWLTFMWRPPCSAHRCIIQTHVWRLPCRDPHIALNGVSLYDRDPHVVTETILSPCSEGDHWGCIRGYAWCVTTSLP